MCYNIFILFLERNFIFIKEEKEDFSFSHECERCLHLISFLLFKYMHIFSMRFQSHMARAYNVLIFSFIMYDNDFLYYILKEVYTFCRRSFFSSFCLLIRKVVYLCWEHICIKTTWLINFSSAHNFNSKMLWIDVLNKKYSIVLK